MRNEVEEVNEAFFLMAIFIRKLYSAADKNDKFFLAGERIFSLKISKAFISSKFNFNSNKSNFSQCKCCSQYDFIHQLLESQQKKVESLDLFKSEDIFNDLINFFC